MVLFCVRIWAYHPSFTCGYILRSWMSHGSSSTVLPLCPRQAAGAGSTQMHLCCSGSLQSTKGSINYLLSVTLWGVWAYCTGGTQWWTQMSKCVGLGNDSYNYCSNTELAGTGNFNWSWWDPFVWGGSCYTFGSQKLRPDCWIPPLEWAVRCVWTEGQAQAHL